MIQLREYATTRARLLPEDLKYLLRIVRGSGDESEPRLLDAITPTSEAGTYDLRAGPFVGRLGLPSGDWIDFTSRFPFADVVRLIAFSAKLPLRTDALRVLADHDDLLVDVLALAFARETERVARQGLAKGYVRRRYLRPPYPGTMDVPYVLGRLFGREDRLATIARRLTTDVVENQVLASAVDVLRRVPLKDHALTQIAKVASYVRSVERIPIAASDVPRIRLTRLTTRYRDALALGEVVLRGQALAPREQHLTGASIVFSMPRVWEACVARWVERAWGSGFRTEGGHAFPLTTGGELTSIADVLVWQGRQPVALYDAKYKWIQGSPSLGDVYQMVTYCERLGLDMATLVYPVAVEPRTFVVGGRAIRVRGLTNPEFDEGSSDVALMSATA